LLRNSRNRHGRDNDRSDDRARCDTKRRHGEPLDMPS
jgi:hypothetical protein